MSEKLLTVSDLCTYFYSENGPIRAVDGISFSVERGEIVGIVGESGSGKSVTALSILNLVPSPGKITNGEILFRGHNLRCLNDNELRSIRGAKIGMVFQEPMSYFNPVFTIGYQIAETIREHLRVSKKETQKLTIESLKSVGFPSPELRHREYPHQMSGGMLQRAMLAMALCCGPELLIADEPTTALDVTIQFQILELLKKIRDERGTSIILITHDFGIIADCADRVVVMKSGRIVEEGRTIDIFNSPSNPYTQELLESMRKLGKG
jgi:ABC-type dipeptide/oligopeptide/nickel transport system ATPase component